VTSVIIDCDPGLDDAIAILLAIKHLNVVGITTVSGNESIEKVTTNALKVLELGGATHIPVVRGSDRPLKRDPVYAPHFHGESGMGGADLPAPTTVPLEGHAVEFIIEVGMSASDLVLISIGPLTNIATALRKEPRLRERVKLISMMGGSVTNGNVTPAAEFNVYHDAEAAEQAILALAALSQAAMRSGKAIKLADEITLCQQYVALERWRYGERLALSWKLPDELPDIDIPCLKRKDLKCLQSHDFA